MTTLPDFDECDFEEWVKESIVSGYSLKDSCPLHDEDGEQIWGYDQEEVNRRADEILESYSTLEMVSALGNYLCEKGYLNKEVK